MASSMTYVTICQPPWRYRYHERDVVSHRYAAERAAIGTTSRTAKVLVRPVLRVSVHGRGV
jgi:hypothetical protein